MSAALYDPVSIRDVSFRNRIGVSPMCQYSSVDGFATDWHLVHLGSRAVGGAATVIAEATAVRPDGRITPFDLGIWKPEHVEMLSRITRFVEAHGAVPGIQLSHAGRKASTDVPWRGGKPLTEAEGGWRPLVAPSAIPFSPRHPVPDALTEREIHDIVAAFRDGARRALDAGFKVVEIHAAHGYLIHEFLSPISNQRADRYGGSFENRIRFLVEVVEAIRTVWPESLPLFVRLSVTEWVEGGWDIEQSITLARVLGPLGVDLVDCSSGGNVAGAKIPLGPGYQVQLAERVRREGNIATAAVGLITDAKHADEIVRDGQADFVFLARQLLRDPYWPLHAARTLGIEIPWPVQYERARD
jgi:2,4-dienoyl-CoA reductase-like NADH-dependent reductase (Old Yellow Enzyme family)